MRLGIPQAPTATKDAAGAESPNRESRPPRPLGTQIPLIRCKASAAPAKRERGPDSQDFPLLLTFLMGPRDSQPTPPLPRSMLAIRVQRDGSGNGYRLSRSQSIFSSLQTASLYVYTYFYHRNIRIPIMSSSANNHLPPYSPFMPAPASQQAGDFAVVSASNVPARPPPQPFCWVRLVSFPCLPAPSGSRGLFSAR